MKVDDLIRILSRFRPDADIFVTWEGAEVGLRPECVYARSLDSDRVFLDGDEWPGLYKEKQAGPTAVDGRTVGSME